MSTSQESERRGSSRAATWRKAVVSIFSGRGGMAQGTAVDLSPDGLRVTVAVPPQVGSEVEVFLPPRPEHAEDSGLTVTGRVVWTAPHADGLHAVGIRIQQDAPPATAITSRAAAEEMIARVREELRARAAARPATIVRVWPGAVEPAPGNRKWGRAIAALALLLLLFGGSYALMRKLPLHGVGRAAEAPPKPVEDVPAFDASQRRLTQGDTPGALEEFQALARHAKTPAARMIAALGAADALRMQGRIQEAMNTVRRALDAEGEAPKAWREAAAQYREGLMQSGAAATAPPLLVDAVGLLRPGAPGAPGAPTAVADAAVAPQTPDAAVAPPAQAEGQPAAPLRIEVDKSNFTLNVMRGAEAVASFPVGLGVDNTTPEGDFVIANKLIDPDWYNRGERVKAGDPRNPLGRHWMGLGNERGATSYGIHETKETGSIGAARSRGCVRMRPADAAELFRLCGIGTPVRIVE